MFNVLGEQNKVEKRALRQKLRDEQLKSKLSLSTDEVKGRSWADVSDDDEEDQKDREELAHLDSSGSEDEPDSPARSPQRSPVNPNRVPAGGYPAAAAPPPLKLEPETKALTKKQKKDLAQKELDDLDAVLAEFGVDVPEDKGAPQQAGESKRAKKKKAKDEAEANGVANGGRTDKSPEPAKMESGEALDAEQLGQDAESRAAALDALKKKAAAAKGGKAKSATAAAAAEAKKRAANVAKPKRDKNAFDR